jgi:uracil-DNA glycosylase family 4
MFTGDRSGDVLYAAMHAVGLASQPTATHVGDGLEVHGVRLVAPVRCAPPANKPTPQEIAHCREYLAREWALLTEVRAVLALGRVAMDGFLALLREAGRVSPRARPAFGHGVTHDLGGGLALFASYHPSQQNTFTGKLTARGFDAVLAKVRRHLDRPR